MVTYISGYVFEGPDRHEEHKAAYERVKHIEGAILRKRGGYANMTVELEPSKIEGLSPLEKLVLADGRPSPFGGRLEASNRVVVYTD